MNTSELIRFAREENGMTQTELAQEMNVSSTLVCRWENGKKPSRKMRKKIESVLNITIVKRKTITIIEGISPEEKGQEFRILKELLQMTGWDCKDLVKAYGERSAVANKRKFLKGLFTSKSRFVHISAHGNGQELEIDQKSNNTACISVNDLKKRSKSKVQRMSLSGSLVNISACGRIDSSFAIGLHESTNVTAVISPLAEVRFSESAVFSQLLYFSLFNSDEAKESADSAARLAQFIDSFNRTKIAYLSVGGTGAYRLDYWWKNEHQVII